MGIQCLIGCKMTVDDNASINEDGERPLMTMIYQTQTHIKPAVKSLVILLLRST